MICDFVANPAKELHQQNELSQIKTIKMKMVEFIECWRNWNICNFDAIPICLPLETKMNVSLSDKKNSMKKERNDSLNW